MARDSSQEIPLRGNSRHTSIHPVDINGSPLPRASPGPGGYTQVKHYKKWFPWMIPAFVIANTVVFIITMYVNDCPKYGLSCVAPFLHRFSFQPFKENPLLGPSSATLEKMGGLDVNKVIHGYQGWRLISCIWLHAGVFHLLANMLSLLIIGIRLEREFGFVKIGVLYNIAGIGGSVLSALFVRSNISVGASGAVFGLLGAMLSELIINWTIYSNKVASFIMLVIIILVNLGVGVLPHVDNFAHIGGFLSGFLLGFVFLIRPHFGWVSQKYVQPSYALNSRRPHKYKKYQYALWIISLILLIIGFTVGLMLLFKGVDANSRCSWCHYLSCVPTSRWSCKTQPGQCTFDDGYPKNLTCVTNGKSKLYYLSNITGPQLQGLCAQLCN